MGRASVSLGLRNRNWRIGFSCEAWRMITKQIRAALPEIYIRNRNLYGKVVLSGK